MRLLIGIVLFVLMFSGCVQEETIEQTPEEPPPEMLIEHSTYSNDSISFDYPDWNDAFSDDDAIFMLKSDGICIFSAGRYPAPSTLMKNNMEEDLGAVFEDDYATYIMSPGGIGYNAITRLIYCNYETYAFSIMCPGPVNATILSSAHCNKRSINTKPGLGLMPIPANDSAELMADGFKEARANGADVLSWYLFWGPLADNWTISDYVMEPLSYEGKTAVLMNVIYVNLLGEYPPEFESFDDPGFKEAFAEFSIDFIERYDPDYYFIGGEVDIYLDSHRDQIPAYKEVLAYTYKEIKKVSPETQVGFVVAYHYSTKHNATDIIETLAPESDLIGYTVHPYEGDYNYENISKGLEYLEDVRNVVPGKPYAIIETGWSSSPLLDSSEDKQVEFLHDFFSFYESTDAEFVIWFSQYELGDCTEAAEKHLSELEHRPDDEYVEAFKEFMCSSGLKRTDGTPKKAWSTWQEYIKE